LFPHAGHFLNASINLYRGCNSNSDISPVRFNAFNSKYRLDSASDANCIPSMIHVLWINLLFPMLFVCVCCYTVFTGQYRDICRTQAPLILLAPFEVFEERISGFISYNLHLIAFLTVHSFTNNHSLNCYSVVFLNGSGTPA